MNCIILELKLQDIMIASPFAAVNLNQPPVGKTGFPWGQKWSLKNSSVIGDTSDPESQDKVHLLHRIIL